MWSILCKVFLVKHTLKILWCSLIGLVPSLQACTRKHPLREKCPNMEFFLACIFLYSDWIQRFTSVRMQENTDQKNLRIWTLHAVTLPLTWNGYDKRISSREKFHVYILSNYINWWYSLHNLMSLDLFPLHRRSLDFSFFWKNLNSEIVNQFSRTSTLKWVGSILWRYGSWHIKIFCNDRNLTVIGNNRKEKKK